jgi:U6 snRNA-associated Sm-like protein LSm4
MLVELKNGETLNGHLINCDTWMNLTLKEVVQTSPEGDRFTKLAEVYVRGNNVSRSRRPVCVFGSWERRQDDLLMILVWQIKYLRVPDEIVEQAKEQQQSQQGGQRGGRGQGHRGEGGRGDRGGRGPGRGGRGRGRGGPRGGG